MNPLAIAIGYDSKEPLAFQVLAHSIVSRTSRPVTIVPVAKHHLKGIYMREDSRGTTEFSLTRFLAPYMVGFTGWAIFMDCDMLCQVDIYDVFRHVDDKAAKAVYVCQHDYIPKEIGKATGVQTAYPRKNWSSMMLMHTPKCAPLSPQYVNAAPPSDLHRFAWLRDEQIGSLPLTWNWLVGEYEPNGQAQVLHYTLGTPCFPGYEDSEHADLWWAEYRAMMTPMKTYALPAAEVYAKAGGGR